MKTKSWYIQNFGKKVVELARDYYETDSGKVLFNEDCKYDDDIVASEDNVEYYIHRAYSNLSTKTVRIKEKSVKNENQKYKIVFVPVKENGLIIEDISKMRNALSDLTNEARIQLELANAIIDANIGI